MLTMRRLMVAPVLLASVVCAGAADAHGPNASAHGTTTSASAAKSAPVRHAHQADATDATRVRSGNRAFMCAGVDEQAKSSMVMRSHRIVRGDSLSGIAALYGTNVRALAAANGLKPDAIIRTGQDLVIPQPARPGGGNDWLKYARAPEEPGVVTLSTYTQHFRGRVVEKGHLSAAARSGISALLGVKGDRPPVPDRLLRLLVRVSDTFGGRPIRVVSGYRTASYFSDSRHKQSAAVDFSIPGIPNAVLRQYLLMFDDVGVGYYPNSSFVHLDVRGCAMQWVDYAGPGEAPRLWHASRKYAQRPTVSDLDEIAENVAAVLDGSKGAANDAPDAPEPSEDPRPSRSAAPEKPDTGGNPFDPP